METKFDDIDQVRKRLEFIDNFTWGDFINSNLFQRWLAPIITGHESADDADDCQAKAISALLPGRDGSYVWALLEETHPGRYIHMKSLKLRVLKVRPRGKVR